MSAHNLLAQLEFVDIGDGEEEFFLGDPDVGGKFLAGSNVVPTDATAGYAPGCLYLHLDGTGQGTSYVNGGTKASCAFRSLASGQQIASASQAAVATSALTFSAGYVQAEVQALDARVDSVVALANALRSALVTAEIIKGSA
jgi:hypothetical protein